MIIRLELVHHKFLYQQAKIQIQRAFDMVKPQANPHQPITSQYHWSEFGLPNNLLRAIEERIGQNVRLLQVWLQFSPKNFH